MAGFKAPAPASIVIDDSNYQNYMAAPPGQGMGLVPRDFKSFPVGCMAGIPAFDPKLMPLIPENEWEERIMEQEAKQSSLQHIFHRAGAKALDQNGQGYCVTADTEVLTANGFISFPEYDWKTPLGTVNQASGALEFQSPFEKHVYEYDGPMIYSTNRRVDFGVTPDHQMYVRRFDQNRRTLADSYSFVRAADMGWYVGLMHAPTEQIGSELIEVEIPGDRRYDGDDLMALLGLIVSDGFAASYQHSGYLASFASFRPQYRNQVAALAARVGFKEQPSRQGVWNRWGAQALVAWLKESCYVGGNLGAKFKRVPDLVKWASPRQIKIFLDWFDDRSRDGLQFYTTSKQLADDLQELHLRVGKRSSIAGKKEKVSEYAGKPIKGGPSYVLTVGEVDQLCLDRKKHIETDHYKGLVYCAAVPNHTLVTRRNGTILISSNCWAYSSTGSTMVTRLKEGQPYVRLSGHAVGCQVKGYRDQGGWNGESCKWIREHGVPSVEFWKEKSMSRDNDTAEMQANSRLHMILEYDDLSDRGDEVRLQLATMLLNNIACPVDFNWWGHSVCAVRLIKKDPFTIRILNSWGQWSDQGFGDLVGSKAIPQGCCAPRVTRFSQN